MKWRWHDFGGAAAMLLPEREGCLPTVVVVRLVEMVIPWVLRGVGMRS